MSTLLNRISSSLRSFHAEEYIGTKHDGFIQVKDLSFVTPNGSCLLDNMSFTLKEGAILAIAGPNGAGKTTLLNLLCGLSAPTTGEVTINGINLTDLSEAARARTIAVVGQQEWPDTRLTVQDYVALGQIPILSDFSDAGHADALARVLDITDLTKLAEKSLGALSGGERQRAHIARALAQNPSVLFLDEPTNHLDPDAKGRILSLVADLGITVVMIVHDLVMIPEFATHVALIKSATMTDYGPVSKVLTAERVRETFGVDYLSFHHNGRVVRALDIRKSHQHIQKALV